MNDLVLYTYYRSSSAFRVRLGLALKNVPYRAVPVNILKGETSSPEHVARSPMGYVPCLVVNGKTFVESVAILELLEELYPEPALLPKDPYDRARVRALVEIVNSGTQPLQNTSVLKRVSSDKDAQAEWARVAMIKGLGAFEALMKENEAHGARGPFAYGASMTMADCFLVPQAYNARRFQVDLTQFSRISRALEAAEATKAHQVAKPEAQVDAPAEAHV